MAYGDQAGRAITRPSDPRAQGVCNSCGFWFQLNKLEKQMEYFGRALRWTGDLVCHECLDVPQDQLRPIILPPDPIPVPMPRTEPFIMDYGLAPFTQYILFQPINAVQQDAAVLAALAAASGIATPGGYATYSGTIAANNQSQLLMPAKPTRTWMTIYNPSNLILQVDIAASTSWDLQGNFSIGAGMALLATTGVPLGAMSCIGLVSGANFQAWDF